VTLSAETCLRGVLYTLRERVCPELEDGFAQEAARLAALVLSISANDVDGAVAVRAAENAVMRQIFGGAQTTVTSRDLSVRLEQAARSTDPGLRISELDRENDRLRLLLIELHAHCETLDTEAGRTACRNIWRALADFEQARAPRR
jgi:hypothetical protein